MSTPTPGIFAGIHELAGWQALDMLELQSLMRFAQENSEIQAVFEICYNSLLSGDIMIEPSVSESESNPARGSKRRRDDGDKSHWEEIKRRKRSSLFGAWAWKVAIMEDAIGFAPTTVVPNPDELTAEDDPFIPVCLNVDRLKVYHHQDVFGRHSWRFFELQDQWSGLHSRPFPNMKELHEIVVIGDKCLPDTNGVIHSKVKRLMLGLWSLYQSKVANTMRADKERAHPTIVTVSAEDGGSGGGGGGDDKNVQGAAVRGFNQMTPARNEMSEAAERVHALVKAKNTGDHCLQQALESTSMTLAQAQRQATSVGPKTFEQFQLDAGRLYVPAHMAEAPVELLGIRQAFLESVCLGFGVPMSMVSSGDASGRAKLNSETASPETARIFREAQASRKRQVEAHIGNFYEHIYGDELVHSYIRSRVLREVRGDDADDDRPPRTSKVQIPPSDMARHAKVRVQIPANPQFEQLVMLFDKRILKYDAFCKVVGNQMCLSLDSFSEDEPPSEMDMKIKEAEAMLQIKEKEAELKLSTMRQESEIKVQSTKAESAVSLQAKKDAAEAAKKKKRA